MGGEDLKVGGDAGAVGGIEAGDGEGYRKFVRVIHDWEGGTKAGSRGCVWASGVQLAG